MVYCNNLEREERALQTCGDSQNFLEAKEDEDTKKKDIENDL